MQCSCPIHYSAPLVRVEGWTVEADPAYASAPCLPSHRQWHRQSGAPDAEGGPRTQVRRSRARRPGDGSRLKWPCWLLLLSVTSVSSSVCIADSGSQVSADCIYTLYRSSVVDANMRIHIATFNADAEEAYNRETCDIARELFQRQPGVKVRYWCEKGEYKK